MRQPVLVACAVLWSGLVAGMAQQAPHAPVSMVEDWSSHHVIYVEEVPPASQAAILQEPRFWQQFNRRHAARPQPVLVRNEVEPAAQHRDARELDKAALSERDWSVSLGTGSGGRISGPAKFVFDVTAPPSCTTDFVTSGISVAGSSTQANIIGLNNLYTNSGGTGFCSGTAPKVVFAYNIGAGQVSSSVVLSLTGNKIAFTENNITAGTSTFHVLAFQTSTGNGTAATSPAVAGTGNTAVDTKIAFSSASTTAPYIDYLNDVAYVTSLSTTSLIHKITGVFNGTPTEVTTGGWPATITGTPGISTPVYDGTSKHVFVTDQSGFIDYVDDSVSPAVVHSGSFSFAAIGIAALPVIVDSSRQKVYAFASNPNGTNALVVQADTNLSAASKVTVNIGAASANLTFHGDFNNAYYSGGASTAAFMYVVGNDNSLLTAEPALFNIGFNSSFTLNSTTANGPRDLAVLNLSVTGITASPVTEFFNATLGKDFLFVGVSGSCTVSLGSGCVRSIDITSGFPTVATINNVFLNAVGGTGRIIVDNNSSQSQASSVYYTTLTGATIVKATQSALQ
jgi:hypothetical protein